MVHLYKDPEGETVLNPSSASDTHRAASMAFPTVTNNPDEVASLKQQISELEKKLAEVKKILISVAINNA